MEPLIAIHELTKTYGTGAGAFTALDRVSLCIAPNELVLLIGPSGSGKTTLLSIMGCILKATSGSVMICGKETVGLGEGALPRFRQKYIGFVFQGFNLFAALTAVENVELALDLRGVGKRAARRQAVDLLTQVGLADRLRSFPADLSGGQKQRVAIARALAGGPNVILADEPTASLDWESGKLVMDTLHSLSREHGKTVVVVSHDHRTMGYADRVIDICDGRIVEPEYA